MDRANYNNRFNNKFYIGIYSIIISLCAPAYAESPSNTNIAGPSASATGNVTNQAVQVLQGPFAVNTFGAGVSCQSPTVSVQPFVMGNRNYNWDPESYTTGSGNMGISLGFNIPLDGSLTSLCKERVRVAIERQQAEADKARLDFELVRLIKCGEAMKAGVRFHPQSPYAGICADVIVIQPPAPPQPVAVIQPAADGN